MKKNKPGPNKYVLLVFALISILLFIVHLLILKKNFFGVSLFYSAVAFAVPSFIYVFFSYIFNAIKEGNKSEEECSFLKRFEEFCLESKNKGDDKLPKEICEILNRVFTEQSSHSVKNPVPGEAWKNKTDFP
ncbi:MAG: hypothetical protein RL687_29 [Candidatus Parcubacteria bacterium]|jgi:hypothetical protein